MRWGLTLRIVIAVDVLAFAACDGVERDPTSRYYVAPDAEVDTGSRVSDASNVEDVSDAWLLDAHNDGDAADGSIEAGSPPTLLATGSGAHPDVAIGSGDHTCVVAAGGASTVWCWGANDHGQLGIGTTGDGAITARCV